MQKITPHLWFDKEAKDAARFYSEAFSGAGPSGIRNTIQLHDTPSGDVDILSIELAGQDFSLINAGPFFKFNPSISFLVPCSSKTEVDQLWKRLSDGGKPLMELGEYPFSQRYGWTQDRYGLSWQVMLGDRPIARKIVPILLFTGAVAGKTEDAIRFYTSVFHDAKVGEIFRYGKGEEPEREGNVKYAAFNLEGQEFGAMDSARTHGFAFNEAVSLIVYCDTQKEIDYYWSKLSAVPEAEQCGWLKDRYGVSWQVVPRAMDAMLQTKDPAKLARVTEAFLKMKKFDLSELQRAAA